MSVAVCEVPARGPSVSYSTNPQAGKTSELTAMGGAAPALDDVLERARRSTGLRDV